MSALEGRRALITGAGRGIGAAVVRAFATAGARVFLAARTADELRNVAEAVRAAGGSAEWQTCDVARYDDVRRCVEACAAALGGIDVLVNAAATYGPIGPLEEAEPAEWARAVEVNLLGTMHTCLETIPHLRAAARGRIINFSGGGATSPLPRFSAYAASKAAVVRLTETLATELADANITVNAIAPGAVDTRLQDDVLSAGARAGALYERIRRLRASGAGGIPPELPAGLAVFLASDAAAGLTGKLIAAPHDGWQQWDAARIEELMAQPWLTLRRLDEFTLRPLIEPVTPRT